MKLRRMLPSGVVPGVVLILIGIVAIAEILLTPGEQFVAVLVAGLVMGFGLNQLLDAYGIMCPSRKEDPGARHGQGVFGTDEP